MAALSVACATPHDATSPEQHHLEEAWEDYRELPHPKALAAAIDDENWAYGIGSGPTDAAAGRNAVENCQRFRAQWGVAPPCSLRFVNDADVWPLADALAEFPFYPDFKALWVAGTPDWHMFDFVYGSATQEEANLLAMEHCTEASRPLSIDGTCRLCAIGSGVPCTILEPGWTEAPAHFDMRDGGIP